MGVNFPETACVTWVLSGCRVGEGTRVPGGGRGHGWPPYLHDLLRRQAPDEGVDGGEVAGGLVGQLAQQVLVKLRPRRGHLAGQGHHLGRVTLGCGGHTWVGDNREGPWGRPWGATSGGGTWWSSWS